MKIFYQGQRSKRMERDYEGRFTSFKRKIKSFFRGVVRLSFASLVVYIAFLIGFNKPPIVQTVMAEEKFADYPLLVKICKAESENTQFRKDGRVMRGSITPSDIGFCQINEPIWNDKARDLGYDIYTEDGNKKMAIYIFLNQGSSPWNSSKCSAIRSNNCWK